MPAFVLSTTRPLRNPLAVGEKSTAIMQVPEAATGLEVEQVVLASRAKSPPALNAEMLSELVPEFVSITDCGPDVAPTTVLPKVRLDGFNDTPAAVPLPVSMMVCVPLLALSVMVTTPVRVPLAVGVNDTAISHVPDAATGVEIEQVVPPARVKSPLAARAAMLSGLWPVLVKVTDWTMEVFPTTVLPKAKLEGLSDTPGAVPVPLSVMVCIPPLASSLIVTTPVRTPVPEGANVTAIVQVAPAATGVEVEQVELASRAKSPLAARALIFSGLLPVLVNITDCAAAVVPTTVLPNVRFDGLSETPGNVPVPLSVMVWIPPLALSVMVTIPVRTPFAVGAKVTAIVQL